MTQESFFTQIHQYYGDHKNKIVMTITQQYILRSYKPQSYRKLLNAIYRTHRSSWGYPDVAAIELAHERFMKSDSYDLKKKDVSQYHYDLSITDEEWKDGLPGMEMLKKAVEIEADKKQVQENKDKLDPEKMKEIKKQLLSTNTCVDSVIF